MNLKSETAAQLFCRLGAKRSLRGLDARLFSFLRSPPTLRDVIEINGEAGSGKTQLILHIIARAILPRAIAAKEGSDTSGGCEAGVIVIDTERKFPMLRLILILEHEYEQCVLLQDACDGEVNAEDSSGAKDFVKACLQRLHVVTCDSSFQLAVTLHSLESLVNNDPDICLIVIDSISTFYWEDKFVGGISKRAQEENLRNVVAILRKLVDTYHLILVASTLTIFGAYDNRKRKHNGGDSYTGEYLCAEWKRFVKYRLILARCQRSAAAGSDASYFSLSHARASDHSNGSVHFQVTEFGVELMQHTS